MRQVSGKELARTLERHGWKLLRVSGSHHIYGKDGARERPTIPIHGNRPLKLGLLQHLLKQTGLTEEDLA